MFGNKINSTIKDIVLQSRLLSLKNISPHENKSFHYMLAEFLHVTHVDYKGGHLFLLLPSFQSLQPCQSKKYKLSRST